MKIIKKISLVLFVICLPVMLFTASVSAAANCPWLYKYGFAKYDISQVTGLDDTQLDKVVREITAYWNNGEETIDITVIKNGQPLTLFTEKEVSHMVDVKALFRLAYRWLLITFIYVVVFLVLTLLLWKDRKLLTAGLTWGGGLSIFIMIAIGILALIDFNWLFTQFHLLSFTNDLWLLDPYNDYLLMLFPEGFWFDAAMVCAGLMVLLALILGFTGWRISRKIFG